MTQQWHPIRSVEHGANWVNKNFPDPLGIRSGQLPRPSPSLIAQALGTSGPPSPSRLTPGPFPAGSPASTALYETPGAAPGLLVRGNVDLAHRPVVQNPDGTYSTVRSITITDGGRAVLLPTVVGKRVVSNDQAIQHYRQTGQHLGVFASENQANTYAQRLHEQQAATYAPSSLTQMAGRSSQQPSLAQMLGAAK